MKVYRGKKCGKLVWLLRDGEGDLACCGEPMEELVANTTDGAKEKHVPVLEKEGNLVTVTVGSVLHPMLPEHYIEWIILETKKGIQKVDLQPGMKPMAQFALVDGDEVVAAYEYCNLHGLWKGVL